MAVRAEYSDAIIDSAGNAIASASITVYQVGTTTKITETIYADASGSDTLSNPLTADSAGRFQFYLAQPKRVDLYVSATGYTAYTLEDVDVGRTSFLTVLKTVDETINDSDTYQNDDELKIALLANEAWAFTAVIKYTTGTTPDIKLGWTVPSGAGMHWRRAGGVASDMLSGSGAITCEGSANMQQVELIGHILNGATAGDLVLKWAQNTKTASDTTVEAYSYIIAHRLA